RLRHRVFLFFTRRQPADLVADLAVLHHPVRRLDEAQVVDAGVARETRDQPDIRTFRRLDRAHATVLAVVHVAHFEPGALAREPTRTERAQPPLVRQLRQWVGLVHELRQLRAAED